MRTLVLTYYFPPCDATAGFRPYSWATNFQEHQIETTVITRHWTDEDRSRMAYISINEKSPEIREEKGFTTIYLPYYFTLKRKIGERWLFGMKPLRKLYYFALSLTGNFNIDMDGRAAYKRFVFQYLQTNPCDAVIATAPPFNLAWLAKEISKKYKIPYIIDFRDLWNNHELKKGFSDKGISGFKDKVAKYHIAKWIKGARLVTVATPPYKYHIRKLGYKGNLHVILNGYEQSFYSKIEAFPSKEIFTVSCIGTLYAEQDLDIFINGFKLFLERNANPRIQLRFIGVGVDPEVEAYLKERIPSSFLITTPRLGRMEAIKETKKSHVLYYAGWKDFDGILTTKIFDYLASERTILIAPGDNSSIDELVKNSGSGKIANTIEEVCNYLTKWYHEWDTEGGIRSCRNDSLIQQYSREHQAKIFSELLKQVADK